MASPLTPGFCRAKGSEKDDMKRVQLLLRIDPVQKEKLKGMALASGRSMSAVVRDLIDGAAIREMPPADYHAMTEALRRIGVNLNQIAMVANSTGNVDKAVYLKEAAILRRAVLEIRRAVELR
ncbi:MobC family plasmid mobilization relaxosome protein [Ruminococcaceae bacterium OttesenSCG-928-A16]|nr:MobC family plasmid mobilization relaxosome protein [Ruminococcaceae bacterium OttesenSCG-928-A16]